MFFVQSFPRDPEISFQGYNEYLYILQGCDYSWGWNVNVLSDASVETWTETNAGISPDFCAVKRIFAIQKLNNGKIEANHITGDRFYDQKSKIYYEVANHYSDSEPKLTSITITNDGMTVTAEVQEDLVKKIEVIVIRAYKEIKFSEAGITQKPIPFFHKGNPNDIMETGVIYRGDTQINGETKFTGNHYKYTAKGISIYSGGSGIYIYHTQQRAN